MTTAVSRLHAIVTAPDDGDGMVLVTRADATAIDEIIAELCEDHAACVSCATPLCSECGIGEASGCDHEPICQDCYDDGFCRDCSLDNHLADMGDLARAEQKERAWEL